MARERNKSPGSENGADPSKRRAHLRSASESETDSEEGSRKSEGSRKRAKRHSKTRTSSSKRRRSRETDSDTSSEDDEDSYDSEEESSEEEEERRRRRKERRRKEEKKERRMREKEKEKKRKRKEEKKRKRKKKEDKKKGKKGAVTDSWGKYGVIKETDMWNKRPEFTAWLAEVKQVNLESLPTWEEKQLFKDFMEDHNTATFPSKKYYSLDAYYKRQLEKEIKKGMAEVRQSERTVFNDEEQRRLELQKEREKHKEEQVQALKQSMQSGMAQAMKEQALLREEMALQYKLGNFEAAAAIQRRLDPDVPT